MGERWEFADWHFSDDEQLDAIIRSRVAEAFENALAHEGVDGLLSAWWAGTSWRVMLNLSGDFMPERDYSLAEMVDEAEGWAEDDPDSAIAIAEEFERQAARLRKMAAQRDV